MAETMTIVPIPQVDETAIARLLLDSMIRRERLGHNASTDGPLCRACLDLGHDPDIMRQIARHRVQRAAVAAPTKGAA